MENSSNILHLTVNHDGIDMDMSPEAPNYIKRGVGPFVDEILKISNPSEFDLIGVHPGGPAILKAVESGLELSPEKLEASWDTLKNYGNMSSATIWFIIEKLLKEEGHNAKNLLALAFGPGVTMEGVMLSKY